MPGVASATHVTRLAMQVRATNHAAPLDSVGALAVIHILGDMARRYQTAIIVVTPD